MFDIEQHQRDKLRRLEQRVTALEDHRAKLERILGMALLSACAGTTVEPLALLSVLEDMDAAAA